MSSRWKSAAGPAAIVLLAITTLVLQMASSEEGSGERDSVDSSEDSGRRAALLVARELGFEAEAWSRPPGLLPTGGGALWLARLPGSAGGEDGSLEEDDPWARSLEEGVHALDHYVEFARGGGTVVLPARRDELARAADVFGVEEVAGLEIGSVTGACRVRFAGADQELAVDCGGALVLAPDGGGALEPLVVEERGGWLAARAPIGEGALVVLASDEFLRNDRIGEHDNGLLFVRLVEAAAGDGPLLFDEYALGRWSRRSVWQLAFGPGLLPLTLHGLALVALATWRLSWVSAFPRDGRPLEHASPLARAAAQGQLLARAGRWDLLGRALQRGAWRRVSQHLRLRRHGGAPPEAEDGDGWRERVDRQLSELEQHAVHETTHGAWRAAVLERQPRGPRELEELDGELERLESRIPLEFESR